MRLFQYFLTAGLSSLDCSFVEASRPMDALKRIASRHGFELREINERQPVLVTLYELCQPDRDGFRTALRTPVNDRPLFQEVT